MENVTWGEVAKAALMAVGGVAGMLAVGRFVLEQVEKRRKARELKESRTLLNSAELQRIAAEGKKIDTEFVNAGFRELYETYKARAEKLEKEAEEATHNSFSRPRVTQIYAAVRELRKQVDILDTLILKQTSHGDLLTEVEILRDKLDKVESILP